MQNWYKHGSWNALCDICSRKRKAEDLRKNWKGLFACADTCWEPRHPQDFIRGVEEKAAPDFIRDEPEDVFLETCDYWSSSQMADFGTADCMYIGGNTSIDRLIDIYGASSVAEIAISGRSIAGVYY